ncbi:MAG: BON domain-containing protein [Burkholderiales bacterium]
MKFDRAVPRAAAMALAVSAAFAAALVAAADRNERMPNAKFDTLDKNKDGFVTRDEVKSLRSYGQAFDAGDANKDGRLDRGEFINAEAAHDRIVAGKYVDDSVLTARVKAALLQEPELKSLDVSVETQNGVVLLSGFVRDEGQRQKAMKAAVAVSGVASVKDALVVR